MLAGLWIPCDKNHSQHSPHAFVDARITVKGGSRKKQGSCPTLAFTTLEQCTLRRIKQFARERRVELFSQAASIDAVLADESHAKLTEQLPALNLATRYCHKFCQHRVDERCALYVKRQRSVAVNRPQQLHVVTQYCQLRLHGNHVPFFFQRGDCSSAREKRVR